MSGYKIYLDMDGVIADFEERFVGLFGEDSYRNDRSRKNFSVNWEQFVTTSQFETLNWFKGANELLDYINKLGVEVEILSSSGGPKFHNLVAEQKKKWLSERGLNYKPNIVSGKKKKAEFATPKSILIDDTPEVIQYFTEAGGIGILHKDLGETLSKLKQLFNDA